MVDREVFMLLLGWVLGLVSSVAGALVQHFLSLRGDMIKRKRDIEDEEIREVLQEGREMQPTIIRRMRVSELLRKRGWKKGKKKRDKV